MSIYEYKFWLDMTDMKTGYIRKQGKGIVDIFIIFTGGGPYRRPNIAEFANIDEENLRNFTIFS